MSKLSPEIGVGRLTRDEWGKYQEVIFSIPNPIWAQLQSILQPPYETVPELLRGLILELVENVED